jgi:myo-inositol-1(or 4)-monophosphatase
LLVSDPPLELDRVRASLEGILRTAGALALGTFRPNAAFPLNVWNKTGGSPVSEADIAVNVLLREALAFLARDAAWLSEETEDAVERLTARDVWIVDPIDGTRAYIAGRDDWSISVALVRDGRPAVAGLYAPATDEMFTAVAGAGATRNGSALRVHDAAGLDGARFSGPSKLLQRLAAADPGISIQPRVTSMALRLARVADRGLDVAIGGGAGHDWDLAAADLLVHEAGGVVTTFAGERLVYNRAVPVHRPLVAAGSARQAAVLALLKDRAAEFV